MARELKLDDLHLILLSTAPQREDGHVLPVAPSIAADTEHVAAALGALLQHKLVGEGPLRSTSFFSIAQSARRTLNTFSAREPNWKTAVH